MKKLISLLITLAFLTNSTGIGSLANVSTHTSALRPQSSALTDARLLAGHDTGFPEVIPELISANRQKTLSRLQKISAREKLTEKDIAFLEILQKFFRYKKIKAFQLSFDRQDQQACINEILLLATNFNESLYSQQMDLKTQRKLQEVSASFHDTFFVHEARHFLSVNAILLEHYADFPKTWLDTIRNIVDSEECNNEESKTLRNILIAFDYYEDPYLASYIVELTIKFLENAVSSYKKHRITLAKMLEDSNAAEKDAVNATLLNMDKTADGVRGMLALIKIWQRYGLEDFEKNGRLDDLIFVIKDRVFNLEPEHPGLCFDAGEENETWKRELNVTKLDLFYLAQNLFSNSFDARRKDAPLAISVSASVDEEAGQAVFVYKDNGTGMTQGTLERVRRGESFTTKGELGSGKGIPIIFDIVQKAGGTIEVDSTLGKGTTFTITLSLARASSAGTGDHNLNLPPGTERIFSILGNALWAGLSEYRTLDITREDYHTTKFGIYDISRIALIDDIFYIPFKDRATRQDMLLRIGKPGSGLKNSYKLASRHPITFDIRHDKEWVNLKRPGQFGGRFAKIKAEYDAKYGPLNWRFVWKIGDRYCNRPEMIQLYEDAYFEFLNNSQNTLGRFFGHFGVEKPLEELPDNWQDMTILDYLVNYASDVYDDAPSNVDSVFDYKIQETGATHLQDIAIRRVIKLRMGLEFKGNKLVQVRGDSENPIGRLLTPGKVPFHKPELIIQPHMYKWWDEGSIEAFYQECKYLQVAKSTNSQDINISPEQMRRTEMAICSISGHTKLDVLFHFIRVKFSGLDLLYRHHNSAKTIKKKEWEALYKAYKDLSKLLYTLELMRHSVHDGTIFEKFGYETVKSLSVIFRKEAKMLARAYRRLKPQILASQKIMDNDEIRKYFEDADDYIGYAVEFLNGWADFIAKDTPTEVVSLREALQRLYERMQQLEGGLVKFSKQLKAEDIEDGLNIAANEPLLYEIFAELIDNALSKGAKRISIKAHKEDTRAVIEVADDGDGISDEMLKDGEEPGKPAIFDLDVSSRKESNHGGLGLAVAWQVIQDHGGTIEVDSTLGKGTTFTITLSLARASSAGLSIVTDENIVPVITPFRPFVKGLEIDREAIRRFVGFLMSIGVKSTLVMGATGEFADLPNNLRQEAIKIFCEEAKGKLKLFVNATGDTEKETLENVKFIESLIENEGAIIHSIVVAPLFYLDENSEVIASIRKIQGQMTTDTYLVLYNNPGIHKAKRLNPDNPKIVSLESEIVRILGLPIKDSSGDTTLLGEYAQHVPTYQGNEGDIIGALKAGAKGIVGSTGNFLEIVQLLFEPGLTDKQREQIQEWINENRSALTANLKKIPAAAKEYLYLLGICSRRIASKKVLTPKQRQAIKAIYDSKPMSEFRDIAAARASSAGEVGPQDTSPFKVEPDEIVKRWDAMLKRWDEIFPPGEYGVSQEKADSAMGLADPDMIDDDFEGRRRRDRGPFDDNRRIKQGDFKLIADFHENHGYNALPLDKRNNISIRHIRELINRITRPWKQITVEPEDVIERRQERSKRRPSKREMATVRHIRQRAYDVNVIDEKVNMLKELADAKLDTEEKVDMVLKALIGIIKDGAEELFSHQIKEDRVFQNTFFAFAVWALKCIIDYDAKKVVNALIPLLSHIKDRGNREAVENALLMCFDNDAVTLQMKRKIARSIREAERDAKPLVYFDELRPVRRLDGLMPTIKVSIFSDMLEEEVNVERGSTLRELLLSLGIPIVEDEEVEIERSGRALESENLLEEEVAEGDTVTIVAEISEEPEALLKLLARNRLIRPASFSEEERAGLVATVDVLKQKAYKLLRGMKGRKYIVTNGWTGVSSKADMANRFSGKIFDIEGVLNANTAKLFLEKFVAEYAETGDIDTLYNFMMIPVDTKSYRGLLWILEREDGYKIIERILHLRYAQDDTAEGEVAERGIISSEAVEFLLGLIWQKRIELAEDQLDAWFNEFIQNIEVSIMGQGHNFFYVVQIAQDKVLLYKPQGSFFGSKCEYIPAFSDMAGLKSIDDARELLSNLTSETGFNDQAINSNTESLIKIFSYPVAEKIIKAFADYEDKGRRPGLLLFASEHFVRKLTDDFAREQLFKVARSGRTLRVSFLDDRWYAFDVDIAGIEIPKPQKHENRNINRIRFILEHEIPIPEQERIELRFGERNYNLLFDTRTDPETIWQFDEKGELIQRIGNGGSRTSSAGEERDVYLFGGDTADGNASMASTLSSKGANLAEMTNLGLPVPPGFTIPSNIVRRYNFALGKLPQGVSKLINENLPELERRAKAMFGQDRRFADPDNPLFLSVRSGAELSSPGTYKTITKVGLCRDNLKGYGRQIGNITQAYIEYIDYIADYAENVLGNSDVLLAIESLLWENSFFQHYRMEEYSELPKERLPQGLSELADKAEAVFKQKTGVDFPKPKEQLIEAAKAVIHSCHGSCGAACNIQTYVFGNRDDGRSGSGVVFTRNPLNGKKGLYGSFKLHVEGEKIVTGALEGQRSGLTWNKPEGIEKLREIMPDVYSQLLKYSVLLEEHFNEVQDIEFTIENGKLFLLQTRRNEKFVTPLARLRILLDFEKEGRISGREVFQRLRWVSMGSNLDTSWNLELLKWLKAYMESPVLREDYEKKPIASGIIIHPGIVCAKLYTDCKNRIGEKGIAVVGHAFFYDMYKTISWYFTERALGALTESGGFADHIAVTIRGEKKIIPYISGVEFNISNSGKTITFAESGEKVRVDSYVILDANNGFVYRGKLAEGDLTDSEIEKVNKGLLDESKSELFAYYKVLLQWIVLFEIEDILTDEKRNVDGDITEPKIKIEDDELYDIFIRNRDLFTELAERIRGTDIDALEFLDKLRMITRQLKIRYLARTDFMENFMVKLRELLIGDEDYSASRPSSAGHVSRYNRHRKGEGPGIADTLRHAFDLQAPLIQPDSVVERIDSAA